MPDAVNPKAMVKGLFNTVAPSYDTGPGCFAHFGEILVKAADIQPGHRVLDIATGRGAALFPAIRAAGSGEAIGVDLAEQMVKATTEEAAKRGLKAQIIVMDGEQLDFPDESF